MKDKKGFTLIEVLAVVIIIGIIAIIAIPSISRYLGDSKNTVYTSYEHTMVEAAKNRVVNCITNNEDCNLPAGSEEQKMYLDLLIEEGYLDNMKDPESSNFCDNLASYVSVKGKTAGDYIYNACLYCGDYLTDSEYCVEVSGSDGDKPVCGAKTGDSTRWTNQNRTVTIGCSDQTSGCEQPLYSKTFTHTTANGIGTITIRDRSGNAEACEVNAYVDKTLPTCKIEVVNDPAKTGEYIASTGWYSMKATGAIQDMADADSGLLTYGMGTSVKNRDYNKQNEVSVTKSGITTVIGYVKDKATNEGLCAKEIKIGTEVPKFNLFYGYQIFPNKEDYTSNGATISSNNIVTTSTTPTINFVNMTKYKNLEKVKVLLINPISTTTTGTLTVNGLSVNGLMQHGSKEIVFLVPTGTYENISIQFGNISGETYVVDRIELLTQDGSTWTDKDLSIYVEPIDAGMRTTEISFDNGATWSNTFDKRYTAYTEQTVITRNSILMTSRPYELKVLIDKVIPAVTVKATKVNAKTEVSSDNWTNEGLEFTLTSNATEASIQNIYYCKDTANNCEPNLPVENGELITSYNNITTDYYFRYKVVNGVGVDSGTSSFIAKFDTEKPTCNILNHATISCADQGSRVSGINQWYYGTVNTTSGQYTTVPTVTNLYVNADNKVTTDGTYYLYVKDRAGNVSDVKQAVYYPVTYNINGGTTPASKTSDIVRAGHNADLSPTPKKTAFAFAGWNPNQNASLGLTSYQVNGPTILYAIWLDLWARDLSYDDSQTHLGCSDVQCALDKISEKLR